MTTDKNVPIIIGFVGAMGAGKDTAAGFMKELAEESQVKTEIQNFATALKTEVSEMISGLTGRNNETVLKEMYDRKTKEKWRPLLQWYGTNFRRAEDPDYWVKQLKLAIRPDIDLLLIPDVRFDNEVGLVREFKGHIVRIVNNAERTSRHVSEDLSETFLPTDDDFTLHNQSTLSELQSSCEKVIQKILVRRGFLPLLTESQKLLERVSHGIQTCRSSRA